MLEAVDAQVKKAIVHQDPEILINSLLGAFQAQQISGLVAAKLAAELRIHWKAMGMDGDMYDWLFAKLGKSSETLRRYADVWDMLTSISDSYVRSALRAFPIRDLIIIAQARNEHGEFTSKEYAVLAKATTSTELRQARDAILGKKPAEHKRLLYFLDKEGTLFALRNKKRVAIGILKISESDLLDNSLLAEAIQRLLSRLEVLRS